MDIIDQKYKYLANEFINWAEKEDDIRVVVEVGSRTRTDHLPDVWSDLDLMIYARNPENYMSKKDWLSAAGEVWMALPSRTAGNDPEYLVTYSGGLNVDYVFTPFAVLEGLARDGIVPSVNWRGAMVLLDKDKLAAKTIPVENKAPLPPLPKPDEFSWLVNAFWYTAYYLAKQLRRGDLVMVKQRDNDMKRCLIQAIEWHARFTRPSVDTWHMGRFMDEWADPAAWDTFQHLYAHFDAEDSWQALEHSMDLFRKLSVEIASHVGLPYPAEIDSHATDLVNRLKNGGQPG